MQAQDWRKEELTTRRPISWAPISRPVKAAEEVGGRREVVLSWDHRKFQILVRSRKVPANSYFSWKPGDKVFLFITEMNTDFAEETVICRAGLEVTT